MFGNLQPAEEEEVRILLIRLAQGDSAATWTLWQLYQSHLFDFCLQRMGGKPHGGQRRSQSGNDESLG